ncbi:hypothetical protein GF406_08400 [candidate division KSB1 bacterium]|nr:hypothetical protein [candidate division KSB1 bacterium]
MDSLQSNTGAEKIYDMIGFIYDQAFQHESNAEKVENLVQRSVDGLVKIYDGSQSEYAMKEMVVCMMEDNFGIKKSCAYAQ